MHRIFLCFPSPTLTVCPSRFFVSRERCFISDFEGRVVLGCWLIEPGRVEVGDAVVQRLRVKLEPERDKGFFYRQFGE